MKNKLYNFRAHYNKFLPPLGPNNLISQTSKVTKWPELTRRTMAPPFTARVLRGGCCSTHLTGITSFTYNGSMREGAVMPPLGRGGREGTK